GRSVSSERSYQGTREAEHAGAPPTRSRFEQRGPIVEHAARLGVTGKERFDESPEAPRMIELDQVRDLVCGDVVREVWRKLHEPPVEPDDAVLVAAAPFRAGVGELERRELRRHARGV